VEYQPWRGFFARGKMPFFAIATFTGGNEIINAMMSAVEDRDNVVNFQGAWLFPQTAITANIFIPPQNRQTIGFADSFSSFISFGHNLNRFNQQKLTPPNPATICAGRTILWNCTTKLFFLGSCIPRLCYIYFG